MTITEIATRDARYKLPPGYGADAVHCDPTYAYATTMLKTDTKTTGTGLAFTLGGGNELVCRLIEELAKPLIGREIEELMAGFGAVQRSIADHHLYRWLGPHKGTVHLALASITNACFDLWAKSRGVPLWKLLLDLSSEQIVSLLDLSYLEDILSAREAVEFIASQRSSRSERTSVIESGYPGYDTSVGWFNYTDEQIRENVRRAAGEGFTAMKLKVGSKEASRDLRRARLVRETAGDAVRLMVDANQQWTLPVAVRICLELAEVNPYWVEEPTHPDDVAAHQTLARAITPIPIALGEHVPNRIMFKNFIQGQACQFVQVDAVRVAGVSEFIAVSLLAKKFNLKVVPHVGDMGQLHQHLVLFNHIGLGLEKVFLEYIPHLQGHFVHAVVVKDSLYRTPQVAGATCDLK